MEKAAILAAMKAMEVSFSNFHQEMVQCLSEFESRIVIHTHTTSFPLFFQQPPPTKTSSATDESAPPLQNIDSPSDLCPRNLQLPLRNSTIKPPLPLKSQLSPSSLPDFQPSLPSPVENHIPQPTLAELPKKLESAMAVAAISTSSVRLVAPIEPMPRFEPLNSLTAPTEPIPQIKRNPPLSSLPLLSPTPSPQRSTEPSRLFPFAAQIHPCNYLSYPPHPTTQRHCASLLRRARLLQPRPITEVTPTASPAPAPLKCLQMGRNGPLLRVFHERARSTWTEEPPGLLEWCITSCSLSREFTPLKFLFSYQATFGIHREHENRVFNFGEYLPQHCASFSGMKSSLPTSMCFFHTGFDTCLALECVILHLIYADGDRIRIEHAWLMSFGCLWNSIGWELLSMTHVENVHSWTPLHDDMSGLFAEYGGWRVEHHFVNGSVVGVQWILLDCHKISIPLIWILVGPLRIHSFSLVFSTLLYAHGQMGFSASGAANSIPDHLVFSSTFLTYYGLVIDMFTTYYHVLVPVLVCVLISFVGRMLLVDGSLSVSSYSFMTPLKQEFICLEIPNPQFHSLKILIATVKGLDGQVLPPVADIFEILKEYLRSCKFPDLKIKSYSLLKILGAEHSQHLKSYFQLISEVEMVAGELSNCLAALGLPLHSASALLGLIVIAWGNAVVEHKRTSRLYKWNLALYNSSISFIAWHLQPA